jgi:D-tyrosyl-tRNA(Tyr) deacylase
VRALVQRVSRAAVTVGDEPVVEIGRGLLVLLGVAEGDGTAEADRLAAKLGALRVFEDADGRMNLAASEAGADMLVVSNFTLYADTRKGNRPSFAAAAGAEAAEPLYERVRDALGAQGGRFGARMNVELVNDGPVTLILDS